MGAGAIAGLQMLTSIAGAGMGFMQAQQQADAQNAYYEQNAIAARRAAVQEYANVQNSGIQQRNADEQKKFETAVQGLRARGTVREAAGSAGVTGLSVDALVADYYGQEGRQQDAIDQNYEITKGNIRSQMDSIQSQTTARINSVPKAQDPSFAPFLLRGLSGVVSAGAGYLRNTHFTPMYNYNLGIS
jgi:hypothetical protein